MSGFLLPRRELATARGGGPLMRRIPSERHSTVAIAAILKENECPPIYFLLDEDTRRIRWKRAFEPVEIKTGGQSWGRRERRGEGNFEPGTIYHR